MNKNKVAILTAAGTGIGADAARKLSKEEKEMLEDLVLTAINDAVVQSHEIAEKQMNDATGNLLGNIRLPGM